MIADYLLLKGAIIDGGEPEKMTDQDWLAVYVLYKQSMTLDPYFYTTAYYIQGNLVWRGALTEKAIDLLKTSVVYRSWDWNPKWFLAFDYANFLNDKDQAINYLNEAAKMPDAPPIFSIIAARLQQKEGNTLASIAMLKAMYEQSQNEEFKKVLEKRIQAHIGVYQLEQAVAKFKEKFFRLPESLEDLVKTNIIQAIPLHPYDGEYVYDPETGSIDYGKPRNIQKSSARTNASILNIPFS